MTVDFEIRRERAFAAATVSWKGPWSDRRVRQELEGVAAWARAHRLRIGRWILVEKGERSFQAAVEVRGKARGSGRVRVRRFPATRVVCVEFDPEALSARVVYHGLNDFLKWRRKDRTFRSVGDYREVYSDNPWTNRKAWSKICVEAVVRP